MCQQPSKVGMYTVVVTNFAGFATSSNAVLAIAPSPPVITVQPVSQAIFAGMTAQLNVDAIGNWPLPVQWNFNGTNILNATNLGLTLTGVQLTNGGNYSVLVTNALGAVQSSNATLTVLACDPAPSGIVSWWAGEGNALDNVGINNGALEGSLGFAPGKIGQAFCFNHANEDVKMLASQSLNVGVGSGFTLEAWVNCFNVVSLNPIFEWNLGDGKTQWGVHFHIGADGPGSLYANVVDSGGKWHSFSSAQGIVASNVFQHAALTCDQTTGTATIYCNGAVVAQSNLGRFTPQTSYSLYLGRRPGPDAYLTFAGLIDEPSVYNRAVSSNEIATIYQARSDSKCPIAEPPMIFVQPTNPMVQVNGTVALTVVAGGPLPLAYQWSCNGTNLVNATNTTLILTNVQSNQSGNYSVLVANHFSSTNSTNAILTVIDTLDHFAWSHIPSPRFVNAPFGVSFQALDSINQVFTNFTGTAILTAPGVPVNPSYADGFIQGAWTGSLTISQSVSNVVLQASHSAGHVGLANPINGWSRRHRR